MSGVRAQEPQTAPVARADGAEPLVQVRDLAKHFPITRGILIQRKIGSVRADHVEPSFVEKLTKSHRARALVLRVWIAVGFNADNALDYGVNSRCSGLFPLRIRWPINIVPAKPAETKRRQEHAYHD